VQSSFLLQPDSSKQSGNDVSLSVYNLLTLFCSPVMLSSYHLLIQLYLKIKVAFLRGNEPKFFRAYGLSNGESFEAEKEML